MLFSQVVVIDPVIMSMTQDLEINSASVPDTFSNLSSTSAFTTCPSHNYETMKPIVMASWRLGSFAASDIATNENKGSEIIAESRVLQEVLPIANSKVNLVYNSARARGYLSTIELRLTPNKIPKSLKTVKLRITIEGVLFEKTFEADPNLKYTYSWRRLNIYRQRVYGTTTAVVRVGYTYDVSECSQETIWNIQTTKISGQGLPISNIG